MYQPNKKSVYARMAETELKSEEGCRRDKRIWVEEMAEQAKDASERRGMGELYQITRKLTRKTKNGRQQVKRKDDRIIAAMNDN